MSSSNQILVTIHTADPIKFGLPVPMDTVDLNRATTVFHVLAEDNSVSFLGTYDQLLDFAAELAQKIMSWPLVSGRSDWFDPKVDPAQGKVIEHGDRSNDGQGVSDFRWSSSDFRPGPGIGKPPGERTG